MDMKQYYTDLINQEKKDIYDLKKRIFMSTLGYLLAGIAMILNITQWNHSRWHAFYSGVLLIITLLGISQTFSLLNLLKTYKHGLSIRTRLYSKIKKNPENSIYLSGLNDIIKP